MHYFSYGSNMSGARMRKRVSSAQVITVAGLKNHRLKFHKASKDGSSKCDIVETKIFTDVVYGVVYEIDKSEEANLDRAEGLGYGYKEKTVQVTSIDNQTIFSAKTYYANKIDEQLKPYHWYKEHVLRGAKENKLPAEYVKKIENVSSESDPEQKRHAKEISIYSRLEENDPS